MTAPENDELVVKRAYAVLRSGRAREALAELRRAAERHESSIALQVAIANVLLATGRIDESIECARRLLVTHPDLTMVRSNLAKLLQQQGRYKEAADQYRQLVQQDPGAADAHYRLGGVLQDLGYGDEALSAYRKSVAADPDFVRAWYGIAMSPGMTLTDDEVERLQVLRTAVGTSRDERMRLAFALGRHFEKAGCPEEASAALIEGNAMWRAARDYDIRNDLQAMQNLADCFDVEFFERWAAAGVEDRRPIFIVGMPRSGTTLVEQMLASHSRVHGAGELRLLTPAILESFPITNGLDYTCSLAEASTGDFTAVARRYLGSLPDVDADRVTDKLPHNFLNVGMIHALFPNATIVHCRRDPRDTCFSIFKQLFGSDGHAYAYDLEDLANYYNAYRALMDHWERVLPGRIHSVQYERFVEDAEQESRRVLEACGLDWEPDCLEFHRLRRPIVTLSGLQVREPVHDASIGAWRPYEKMLAPLLERLTQ